MLFNDKSRPHYTKTVGSSSLAARGREDDGVVVRFTGISVAVAGGISADCTKHTHEQRVLHVWTCNNNNDVSTSKNVDALFANLGHCALPKQIADEKELGSVRGSSVCEF